MKEKMIYDTSVGIVDKSVNVFYSSMCFVWFGLIHYSAFSAAKAM